MSSSTREGLLLLAEQGFIVNSSTTFQLTKLPFIIRLAKVNDVEQLLLIEKECWKHLQSDRNELIRRLKNSSNDQFVAEIQGKVVGVMYTQRLQSIELLKEQANFETQTNYHDPSGTILQLLGVAVLPEYASLNISLLLRDFVLLLTKSSSDIQSVIAMTRCSNTYGSEECYFTHFREDPTVLFHVNGGAEIIEIVKNYRVRDTSNYGHSVLIKYSIKDEFHDFDFTNDNDDLDEVVPLEHVTSGLSNTRQLSSDDRRTISTASRARSDEKDFSEFLKNLTRQSNNTSTSKAAAVVSDEDFIGILNHVCRSDLLASSSLPLDVLLERPFMELGLDSLQMIELRNHLLHRYQLPETSFPPTVLFDYSTPNLLLKYINKGCPVSTITATMTTNNSKPMNRRRSESGVALPSDPVAIGSKKEESLYVCGLSCRLPGGAHDPDSFYQLLLRGETTFTEIPKSWQTQLQVDVIDSSLPKYASFLSDDVASTFDPNFFGISVNEAHVMDPHQKVLLEIAHEALTDAGLLTTNAQHSRIGVFVGACNNEWIVQTMMAAGENGSSVLESPYVGGCVAQSSLANRISYCLGLHGPSLVIDTACSSSFSALHVALQSLEKGECDYALVASADLLLSPLSLKIRDVAGMLSKNACIRAFGEGADGYIRGEGAVAFVIGRSSILAQTSSTTPIYAKVLGSVVNHDGKSASFTAPNGIAQRNLLQDALEKCRLRASEVDYIECHGTGTRLGDPIEWNAIKEVFLQQDASFLYDPQPLVLSAVKTNIGHLEGCAGLVGLLKAVLSAYHGVLPRSPNGIELNSFIDLKQVMSRAALILPTENVTLRSNAVVGISSFGSGGSNGHVMIQAYQSKRHPQRRQSNNLRPKIAFLFSGQGGLNADVAKEWWRQSERFRSHLRQIDALYTLSPSLSSLFDEETKNKSGYTTPPQSFEWLKSPVHAHLILFVIEFLLTQRWVECGIQPSVVLGHSFGEIPAAVTANILTYEEALELIYRRAVALTSHLQDNVVMTALRASKKDVLAAMEALGYVSSNVVAIAAFNGPKSTVLSGTQEIVTEIIRELKISNYRNLSMNVAYHSPLIQSAAEDFKSTFMLKNDPLTTTPLPFVSCLTGENVENVQNLRSSEYWCRQMLSTVQFEQSMKTVTSSNCQIIIEIGPDASFSTLAVSCLPVPSQTEYHVISSFNNTSKNVTSSRLFSDLQMNICRVQKLLEGKLLGGRFSKLYKPITISWRSSLLPNARQTPLMTPDSSPSSPTRRSSSQISINKMIEQAVLSLIGEERMKEINRFTPFTVMGIDSLGSIVMRNMLSKEFKFNNLELSQGIIFQYQNISELSEYIQELLDNRQAMLLASDLEDSSHPLRLPHLHKGEEQTLTPLNQEFPTTSIQQSMIFHHLSDPSQASFIESFVWEAEQAENSSVNIDMSAEKITDKWFGILMASVAYFPGLRTIFHPFTIPIATQTILSMEEFKRFFPSKESALNKWLKVIDFQEKVVTREQYDEQINQLLFSHRQSFHELSETPLFQMSIILPPQNLSAATFLFSIHHVITDGISTSLLLKKFEEFSSSAEVLEAVSPAYEIVVHREIEMKGDARLRSYWTSHLKENQKPLLKQSPLSWNIDLSDTDVMREYFSLNEASVSAVQRLTKSFGVTLSCFFHALFGIYCSELYQNDVICYGTTIYGRSGSSDMENVFGPTLNTIPFFHRVPADANTTSLQHYLKLVQQQLSDALEFGMFPLAEILKVSSEVSASANAQGSNKNSGKQANNHGNRLFNLIFDYQQNRWDFNVFNDSHQPSMMMKFVKLYDRIGCPLSMRVLVNDKKSTITLIATSECSDYQNDYLKNLLTGFNEMLHSVLSLQKNRDTILPAVAGSASTLVGVTHDFTLAQLKKEFNASYQVKNQKFTSLFPTIKGKTWTLPYVDFQLQCNKKLLSLEAMTTTIFAMFCLSVTKHCKGADFVGFLHGSLSQQRGRTDQQGNTKAVNLTSVPFDLRYNETLHEMIERVEQVLHRNYNNVQADFHTHYDTPLFLSSLPSPITEGMNDRLAEEEKDDDDDIIKYVPNFDKYPLIFQVKRLFDDGSGADVRLYWHYDEIPLEMRHLLLLCISYAFNRWCLNKNDVYRRPIQSLSKDVRARTIKPYRPDVIFPDALLHQPILADETDDRSTFTIVCYRENLGDRFVLSFDEIQAASVQLAVMLVRNILANDDVGVSVDTKDASAQSNGVIAIVMEKGWEQVIACLAVLRLGHAYLPMDAKSWSEHRIRQVLDISNAVAVLTQTRYVEGEGNGSWMKTGLTIPVIAFDEAVLTTRECGEESAKLMSLPRFQPQSTDDLAYLIYTSGSTGVPKGVCCHHKGAMNTIYDLNENFGITSNDKVLGLSSLSFDLSVYDIFGMLSSGGCVVLPGSSKVSPPDPAEWYELVKEEGVTIWNTVPAFMELLVSHVEIIGEKLPESLRLIFMSGDWIPTNLPSRIRAVSENKNLRIISMGGATEAAIWSNIFELGKEGSGIPEGWTSVPYGQPMRNQEMYILNESLEPCEMWVTGGIYIGGVGVAHGYYKNEERTRYQFITHPRTGEKLFRTGDLGRVRPNTISGGLLEILGREDSQVKVNGFRIELGEIEKTLLQHDKIANTVVSVQNNSLCAYVIMKQPSPEEQEKREQQHLNQLFQRLRDICKSHLTEYMIPQHFMVIDEVPLSGNGKIARDRLPKLITLTNNVKDESSDDLNGRDAIIEPKNELQVKIRLIFASILKIGDERKICCEKDTFFALGGNSLLSIQLLFAIRKQLGKVMTVQDLFQYSTIQKIYSFLYPTDEGNNEMKDQQESREDQRLSFYTLSNGRSDFNPPVILFNPAGASGLCYMRYAGIIGDRYPTYAIDDGCIHNGITFSFQSIREVAITALPLLRDILAKHYRNIEGVRRVVLAGWSYGGVVAIEVAKLLKQPYHDSSSTAVHENIDVQCITLFDSPVTSPIFPNGEGSQQDDFPTELLVKSSSEEGRTNTMNDEIQELTKHHFDLCTALLEKYYLETENNEKENERILLSCPVHDIRAEKSNYFIPFESVLALTVKKESVERSMIDGGDHWNIITGEYVQQSAEESLKFWDKHIPPSPSSSSK